jgi:hypothetical protein
MPPVLAVLLVAALTGSSVDLGAQRVAQAGAIKGTVVDASTGAPLPGVVVVLQGTDREVITGADGSFVMTDVPASTQTLFVSLVGYGLARPDVEVRAAGVTELVIPLAPGTGAYTESVTVVSDPVRGSQTMVPSAQVLNSGEILELRGVLTDDPLRAVQALPSVATGDDFRSEFSVRGSDFAHVGLSVDGIPIGWPVHTVHDREAEGSISLVNGSVLDSVTLLGGAHPQDRPGRTGAWVDLAIREGSRAALGVHGSLSASAASVMVEGPFGSGAKGAWLVSARQSYLQWLLDRLDHDGQTAFGFTDVQAKLVFDATPRQQLQVTFVGGDARLTDEQESPNESSVGRATARSGLVALAWRSTFTPSLVLTQRVAGGVNDFRTDATLGTALADGSSSRVAYRAVADWAVRSALSMQVGAYLQHHRTNETYIRFHQVRRGPPVPVTERVAGSASLAVAHGRLTWMTARGWSFDAGVMAEPSTLIDPLPWSPWLLTRVPLARGFSLRGGFDSSRQTPELDQVAGTFKGDDLRPERARQFELALEQRWGTALRWQVTAYDRREHDILRLEGSEPYLLDGQVERPSLTPFWANALTGSSRGVELLVQSRASSGLAGWIGYAYGKTRYEDVLRDERYWGDYDQRHTVNAFALLRLSPRTSVSGKLRVASNFPIPGYFESRGDELWLASERNLVRLPLYSRLDLRANHTFTFDRRRLTVFVELVNVLGRENLAADRPRVQNNGRVTSATHSLFPFLPSAGLMVDF